MSDLQKLIAEIDEWLVENDDAEIKDYEWQTIKKDLAERDAEIAKYKQAIADIKALQRYDARVDGCTANDDGLDMDANLIHEIINKLEDMP